MIKPNPQIELHPAYMWTCDHCGEENFERCMVRDLVSGYDEESEADELAEVISELSDEEIEAILGNENEEGSIPDVDDEEDDNQMVAVSSQSVPQCLECCHCGAVYSDVVLSQDW